MSCGNAAEGKATLTQLLREQARDLAQLRRPRVQSAAPYRPRTAGTAAMHIPSPPSIPSGATSARKQCNSTHGPDPLYSVLDTARKLVESYTSDGIPITEEHRQVAAAIVDLMHQERPHRRLFNTPAATEWNHNCESLDDCASATKIQLAVVETLQAYLAPLKEGSPAYYRQASDARFLRNFCDVVKEMTCSEVRLWVVSSEHLFLAGREPKALSIDSDEPAATCARTGRKIESKLQCCCPVMWFCYAENCPLKNGSVVMELVAEGSTYFDSAFYAGMRSVIGTMVEVVTLFLRMNYPRKQLEKEHITLERLVEATKTLVSASDISAIRAAVEDNLAEIVEASRSTLVIVESKRVNKGEAAWVTAQHVDQAMAAAALCCSRSPSPRTAIDSSRMSPVAEQFSQGSDALFIPVRVSADVVAVLLAECKMDCQVLGVSVTRYFDAYDERLGAAFSEFVAIALEKEATFRALACEKLTTERLLDVSRDLIDCDVRTEGAVVHNIVQQAKDLVHAEQCIVYLQDKSTGELYLSLGNEKGKCEKAIALHCMKKRGCVEYDASSTPHGNLPEEISCSVEATKTIRNLVAQPILEDGSVHGVAILINKADEQPFSESDRRALESILLFASVALRHSHLVQFCSNAAREAIQLRTKTSFHACNRSSDADLSCTSLVCTPKSGAIDPPEASLPELPLSIALSCKTPTFHIFEAAQGVADAGGLMVRLLGEIFLSTGLPQKFGCAPETLYRFIIACRRKYRNVPYHNFYHAVDACQTMHTFLYAGKAADLLTPLECFVLLATAVVHDLDHMGLNNSFHLKTDSPLGMLSNASGNNSVLEVHHCNIAIQILEDPMKNIFGKLTGEDATSAYSGMIDCVLATDMARHKELLARFDTMTKKGFDVSCCDDRRLAMQTLMKAADISNVTKPFALSKTWGMMVTEEFFQQGEREKERGLSVLPMFDRSQNQELAKGQLGFIQFVAEPFFRTVVSGLFKGMQWCVDNIASNTRAWNDVLTRHGSASSPKTPRRET